MLLTRLSTILLLMVTMTMASPVKTKKLREPGRMGMLSCRQSLKSIKWSFTPPAKAEVYYTECHYPPAVGSMGICAANYFGEFTKNFNDTMKAVWTRCTQFGNSTENVSFFADQYINATDYVTSTEGLNLKKANMTAPVSIPKNATYPYYHYYDSVYYNWDTPNLFASFFYFYFIFVFILVGIVNYAKRLGYFGNSSRMYNWYRRNISIPALFNRHHTQAPVKWKVFSTLVPTRVETIIVFFFVCLNVLLSAVHYDVSTLYKTRTLQLIILLADRTGLLSFGLIPMLTIFAGRNNILIKLTGLPYTSFIMFHKWVSRLMFLHALIHSVCWTAYAVSIGYLSFYVSEAYWVWGVVATTIAGLMCFQAMHYFRTMSYDLFVAIHIVFASLFIVGCWWHCYDIGYMEWLYASIALWCFDRLLRVARIFAFGVKDANVEYISDETFKVSVQKGRFFNAFPGAFAYLIFFTPYGFWQSHPFCVIDSALNENEITVYIKAKKGMTKYIKKRCTAAGGKAVIKVGVEGPYGHHAPTHKYDTALLMAGGSGIPGLYYHAIDLAKRHVNQQVKLLWSVRNPESVCWFFEELLALEGTKVEVDIYITGAVAQKEDSEEGREKESSESTDTDLCYQGCIEKLSSFVTFHYERPSVEELIVKQCTENTKERSLCVMSCGPARMVDDIRRIVAQNVDRCPLELFEELQVW